MNKITVTFNNYKTYDFITDDINIQENDFVLVTSPVSDSGFGIARAVEVEENTQDTYHKQIVSKLNVVGDLAQEISEQTYYDFGEIFLQSNEITFLYKKDKEKTLQKILSELIDDKIKYIPIQKYDVGNEFYMLQLSNIKTDNCVEIDYIINKMYINISKYDCAKTQTWRNVEFENYVFNNIPTEPVIINIEDFNDTLSESIDIIKNTVSENVRYRTTFSSGEYMLDDYVFEYKTYNGDNDYDFDEMCKEYNIFQLNTKKFIDDNIESIYDTAIRAYSIELILPIQIEVPDKYKELEFALNTTYVKIAEATITALQASPDVYDRYGTEWVDEEDVVTTYDANTIIEFNPKYK
ncbi:hypothetical protein HMPREF1143_1774 [Peptoanaerobacter stomatis]|uniref:Uncharacterized protein n=1 Tax=Peptoanaerobacter stomatis TaxID=796937 RepID=J6HBN9_9FIRM|nr:hypothetical protein [Peptoanaerobacter stomatis]EJU22540.1 hypothetical protein HMPREF1143_1774 [Peptoanaerobacter stomatis]